MITSLPAELQKIYKDMQKCTACRLSKELFINKPGDNTWRLHGWGKEHQVVFIGMNPSSKRARFVKPELIPWSLPLEEGKEFNDTYLHYALRSLDWCSCNNTVHGINSCHHKWFVTNIVKCYTEGQKLNKDYQDCIEACVKNNLIKELMYLKPKAIILMSGIVSDAFSMKFGEIKNSEKVFLKFDTHRPKKSMADYGIRAVFGSIYHPKYWIDARQRKNGQKIIDIPQKERVKEYADNIKKIFDASGVPYRTKDFYV